MHYDIIERMSKYSILFGTISLKFNLLLNSTAYLKNMNTRAQYYLTRPGRNHFTMYIDYCTFSKMSVPNRAIL